MAQDLANFDAMFKDLYLDKIPETIKENFPLSEFAEERDDLQTDGRQVLYPVHVGRNTGTLAIGEGANLPTAGNQQWVDFKVPYKYNYARVQLTAQVMKQSLSSKGAFEKAVHAEIMGAAKDCGRNRNRQLFGNGTGIMAVVNGAVSGAKVVTLKNLFNISGAAGQYNVAQFFAAGQILAFVTVAGAIDAVGTIASVDVANNTVTLTANANITNGDYVCFVSTATSTAIGDSSYNNEIMGLMGMIDDGTYVATYNSVVRSSYPTLNSSVLDLGGSGISRTLVQKLWSLVDQVSDGKITCGFWHHTLRDDYAALLVEFKRFNDKDALVAQDGWKNGMNGDDALQFNGVPFIADRDCPYGTLFVFDETQFFRYVNEPGKWADEDGTVLLRVAVSDQYEARWRIFDNFCYDTPNRGGVMRNVGLSASPTALQLI
ncbi:MAG: phage major capsid protein [Patescibacteria group bacterium]|nr:phage major capsid protein [Patescibacteria group bacterium]